MATWTDQMLSGHTFEIDAVLNAGADAVHYQSLQICTAPRRGTFLVLPDDAGVAIFIDAAGLRLAPLPYRNKVDLKTSIAAGQALLQTQVFGR